MPGEKIIGYWYPAGSSRREKAALNPEGETFTLTVDNQQTRVGSRNAVEVSQRVGNIPRRITLKDHSVFESEDNDAIDAWIRTSGNHSGTAWMHRMESRWRWIGVALIVVVAFVYSSARWGLPWVTEFAANHMPESVIENVSEGSLELMDKVFFEPSGLSEAKKAALIQQFNAVLEPTEAEKFTLHFRKLGAPNAMALPTGDLVVTDMFAEMASAEEFNAVMFHEIGHVVERHGIQQLVRSSIVAVIIALFIGDPTGMEEVLVGLPVFLMQSHYSRSHESEADEYAFRSMAERDIDPIHFATIMEKMERFMKVSIDPIKKDNKITDEANDEGNREKSTLDYLSSHPSTANRINRAKSLSKQFREK